MSASFLLNLRISSRVLAGSGHRHSERPSGNGVNDASSGTMRSPNFGSIRSRMISGRSSETT